MPAATLTIDLEALAANYRAVGRAAPTSEVAPVVKADGYGLGLPTIVTALWQAGARSFFVARTGEGEGARAALGPDRPATIYVLDGATQADAPRLAAADLTPVLNDLSQIEAWRDLAGPGRRPCALHIDTGMNRIGLRQEDTAEAAGLLGRAANLDLTLVMSHLARAAEPDQPRNEQQRSRFEEARRAFPGVRASLAASAGIFLGPDYHLDMVRPGITLYGGGPRDRPDDRFAAVATVKAPVLQIRDLKAGDSVGYGTMFQAPRDMRIALLAIGYADGFLRGSHATGAAWFKGGLAPFAAISMDLTAVDISALNAVKPGDTAELLGPNMKLDEVAVRARTVAHECLVRLGERLERTYAGAAER